MAMVFRYFKPLELLEKSSYFLLGPQATGKSSLVKETYQKYEKKLSYINLAEAKTYLRLKSNPFLLSSVIDMKKDYIAIDEIQRIPELSNEVHRMIEDHNKHFLLIANSTQRPQWGSSGLLARQVRAPFFPLTWFELVQEGIFELNRYLRRGGLPLAYLNEDGDGHSDDYLYNYIDTYLQDEVYVESTTCNLPSFIQFLECAARYNTQILNYNKVAEEAKLTFDTAAEYYQILQNTLMGFQVPFWNGSGNIEKKNFTMSKFYFFDLGIVHVLKGAQSIPPQSELFKQSFIQFVACELRSYLCYKKTNLPLQFWQLNPQPRGVNFVVGDELAILVMPCMQVGPEDLRDLLAIKGQKHWKHLLVVSLDRQQTKLDSKIHHLYWENFLGDLWQDKLL